MTGAQDFTRLAADLDKAAGELAAEPWVDAVAEVIAADAKKRAPVLTGALRASVRAEGAVVTAGSPKVPYAAAVHAREPFITEAASATAARQQEAAEQAVDDILKPLK